MRRRFALRRVRALDKRLTGYRHVLGVALSNCTPESLEMAEVDAHYTALITKALAKRNTWLKRARRWGTLATGGPVTSGQPAVLGDRGCDYVVPKPPRRTRSAGCTCGLEGELSYTVGRHHHTSCPKWQPTA